MKDDITKRAHELAAQQMAMDASVGMPGQPAVIPERSEPDYSTRAVMSEEGAKGLLSMTFVSKSGDTPHVVTRLSDGNLSCTCKAWLSIESRPIGCYRMQEFRRITGDHR